MRRNRKAFFGAALLVLCLLLGTGQAALAAFEPFPGTQYQGIDVSKWQGTIDFQAVADAGIQIVYMRAGQGTDYVDPYFQDNYTKARAAGLKVGFYYYVTAQTPSQARQEAAHFASIIAGRITECLLVGDFEYYDGMTNQAFNQVAAAFLSQVETLTGKKAAIYTSASAARDRFTREIAQQYPLWVAEYDVDAPRENGNWDTWAGFQYTNTGRVAGIRGNVDRDIFTEAMLGESASPLPSQENSPVQATYYTVQPGDTLSSIARKFGVTVQALVQTNSLSDPNRIYPGQTLRIPAAYDPAPDPSVITYTVRQGDTLSGIAQRYGTTVGSILCLNGIRDPNRIFTGEILRIRPNSGAAQDFTYTVRSGDTLVSIARRFGTTAWFLARFNDLPDPNRIRPGQILELAAG